jgi:hypothetical protein
MTEQTSTPFSNQCEILADLWLNYKYSDRFEDFAQYNDLGLPLAYVISQSIVESTPLAEGFITETFDLFLSAVDVDDSNWDSLDDILLAAGIQEV